MRHRHEALAILGVTALCVSATVSQNPVPTRVKLELYGSASGTQNPADFRVDLDVSGPRESTVAATHGLPHGLAALLLGTESTDVLLAHGASLLVVPSVVLPGVFDGAGSFAVPIDLASTAFLGQSLFAQGLCYAPPPDGGSEVFRLTQGLRTVFVAGNEQPPLSYSGPPLTATLLAHTDPKIDTRHELLCSIEAPTSGWSVGLQSTHTDQGVTTVYMILVAPSPDDVTLPVLTPVRLVVDLGFAAAPRIEVMIERRTKDTPSPPVFMLAAAIDRDF